MPFLVPKFRAEYGNVEEWGQWGRTKIIEKLENTHCDVIFGRSVDHHQISTSSSCSRSSKRKLRDNPNSAYRSLHIHYGKYGVFILAEKKAVRFNSRMLGKIFV